MITRILLTILGVVLLSAMLYFWFYLALRLIGKESRRPLKEYAIPFLITAVPVMAVVFWVQGKIEPIFTNNFEGLKLLILEMIFIPALTEETGKFIGAVPALKKFKPTNPVDYILMVGASGLGFTFTESCLDLWNGSTSLGSELTSVFIRGIYPFHLHMQFIMGIFLVLALSNKSKGNFGLYKLFCVLSFVVPMLLHAAHDLISSLDSIFPSVYGFSALFVVAEAIIVPIIVYKVIRKMSTMPEIEYPDKMPA